jgi:hypothetical protein
MDDFYEYWHKYRHDKGQELGIIVPFSGFLIIILFLTMLKFLEIIPS